MRIVFSNQSITFTFNRRICIPNGTKPVCCILQRRGRKIFQIKSIIGHQYHLFFVADYRFVQMFPRYQMNNKSLVCFSTDMLQQRYLVSRLTEEIWNLTNVTWAKVAYVHTALTTNDICTLVSLSECIIMASIWINRLLKQQNCVCAYIW